jgi:hypothetical protein
MTPFVSPREHSLSSLSSGAQLLAAPYADAGERVKHQHMIEKLSY